MKHIAMYTMRNGIYELLELIYNMAKKSDGTLFELQN